MSLTKVFRVSSIYESGLIALPFSNRDIFYYTTPLEEDRIHEFWDQTALSRNGSWALTFLYPALVRLISTNLFEIEPRLIAGHNIVQTPIAVFEFFQIFLADANPVILVIFGSNHGVPTLMLSCAASDAHELLCLWYRD